MIRLHFSPRSRKLDRGLAPKDKEPIPDNEDAHDRSEDIVKDL